MASQAQVLANTENAQFSTGPISDAGKSVSKLNAFRHGLTAHTFAFSPEEEEAFAVFSAAMLLEIPAIGAIEQQIAQDIVITHWRLNRVPSLEANLIALGRLEPAPDYLSHLEDSRVKSALLESNALIVHERQLRNLHLQEQRLLRRLRQLTSQIAALQSARQAEAPESQESADPRPLTQTAGAPLPHDLPEPIGFDFANFDCEEDGPTLNRFDARLQTIENESIRHAEMCKRHYRNVPTHNVEPAL